MAAQYSSYYYSRAILNRVVVAYLKARDRMLAMEISQSKLSCAAY